EYFWIGDGLYTHLFHAHPADCLHDTLLFCKIILLATSNSVGLRFSGYALCKALTNADLGPCVWPSMVGTSPASISCLKRRRSSRRVNSGSLPRMLARALPTAPAGGLYSITAVTMVPRSPGAGRNCTEPMCSMSEPSSERHTIHCRSPSSTISAIQ